MYGNKEVMAKNILRYLDKIGMSQAQLAELLRIHPSSVNAWVKAESYPRIDRIEMMAILFKCTKTDLIEDSETITHTYELTSEEYMMLTLWRQADNDTRKW